MNHFEARSKKSYDKKAANYDETFDGKFTVKFKRVLLNALQIQDGAVVCDVACGNGRLLQMLSEKANFRGFGVDISDNMVAEARRLNPNMGFHVAGCDDLPFEDHSVDVMTVCAAYHHFPNVKKFAEEAKRTIKPGGTMYIAEVYVPSVIRFLCNPLVRFSKAGDVKFYSPKEISELFERNGFSADAPVIDGLTQLIVLRKR